MVQYNTAPATGMRIEHLVAFDVWLRGQLCQQAGAALSEPLPEEWTSLLPPDEDAENA